MGLLFWKKKESRKHEEREKREKEKPEVKPAVKVTKPKREDTGDAYRILFEPLLTEKNTDQGTYAFAVNPQANKIQIAEAIFRVYGARPKKVNIVRLKGKQVRWGRAFGRTKSLKKAIVSFREGEKIEIFE